MTDESLARVRWSTRHGDAFAVAARLLRKGGVQTRTAAGTTVLRHVAKDCLEPRGIEWKSAWGRGNACTAQLVVRCRKCDPCRTRRRREWVARALRECAWSFAHQRRVWFITLTLNPEWRSKLTAISLLKLTPWSEERSARVRRAAQLGVWLKLYLNRLRTRSGCEFRYLAALESHADGEFHLHILLHEVQGQIQERLARSCWSPAGFAHAKLVSAEKGAARRTALYVAKYITKEGGFVRQRASLRYGLGGESAANRRLTAQAPKGAVKTHRPTPDTSAAEGVQGECPPPGGGRQATGAARRQPGEPGATTVSG